MVLKNCPLNIKPFLNNLMQQLKIEIKDFKDESIDTHLTETTDDSTTDYFLWKTTNRL